MAKVALVIPVVTSPVMFGLVALVNHWKAGIPPPVTVAATVRLSVMLLSAAFVFTGCVVIVIAGPPVTS